MKRLVGGRGKKGRMVRGLGEKRGGKVDGKVGFRVAGLEEEDG